MTKVSIIGATGSLGRVVSQVLLDETEVDVTLFSRFADRLPDHRRVTKIAASVFDNRALETALQGADLVFVALSGDLPSMVEGISSAMQATGTKRIIFISSYGIYGELPGQNGRVDSILRPYRKAADFLEKTDLDYTILRPAWFDNAEDRSYEAIPKGQVIHGHQISRLAIADFVKELVLDPEKHLKANLGLVRA